VRLNVFVWQMRDRCPVTSKVAAQVRNSNIQVSGVDANVGRSHVQGLAYLVQRRHKVSPELQNGSGALPDIPVLVRLRRVPCGVQKLRQLQKQSSALVYRPADHVIADD